MAADTDVAGWLRAASQVTVLTGAGISTESGIPDFRGPQGVWTRNPAAQAMFTLDAFHYRRKCARSDGNENPAWLTGARLACKNSPGINARRAKRHRTLGLELRRNSEAVREFY